MRRLFPSSERWNPPFLFPLIISNMRTPKLNTSDFTEDSPSMAYSGAIYPLLNPNIITKNQFRGMWMLWSFVQCLEYSPSVICFPGKQWIVHGICSKLWCVSLMKLYIYIYKKKRLQSIGTKRTTEHERGVWEAFVIYLKFRPTGRIVRGRWTKWRVILTMFQQFCLY